MKDDDDDDDDNLCFRNNHSKEVAESAKIRSVSAYCYNRPLIIATNGRYKLKSEST